MRNGGRTHKRHVLMMAAASTAAVAMLAGAR